MHEIFNKELTYIKDKRIRCNNLFFVGTAEFEEYLKDYFKQRKSK